MEDMKRRKANEASEMELNLVAVKTEDIQTASAATPQNADDGSFHDNSGETGERCYTCDEVFGDSFELMEHMVIHRLQRSNTCPICSERFCRSKTLIEHMMTHTGYRPYKCSVCRKGFKRECRLKEHMMTHTGYIPYKCSICSKGFIRTASLKQHMITHTQGKYTTSSTMSESKPRVLGGADAEGIQTAREACPAGDDSTSHDNPKSVDTAERCHKCGEVFSDSSHLMEHMLTHRLQKPITIAVHSEGFCQSSTLKEHPREHLMTHTGYRRYYNRCSVCSEGFLHSSSLQEHMTIHRQGKCNTASRLSKPELSPVGGEGAEVLQTSTVETLQNEDNGLCNDKPKSVETGERCYICGEVFGHSSDLMEHMMTHRGQAHTTCSVCSKRLTSTHFLREHMMTHTGYRPNKCSVCDKGYIRMNDLHRHMKSHTVGKSTVKTGKVTHKCPLCNEKFARSSMLHQHQKTHFKIEPAEHRCYHCSKLFQHPPDLYRHTTAHTCLVCNQSFCQFSYLNEHSKSHGGQKESSKSNIIQGFKELSKLLKHEKTDDEMKLGHADGTTTRKLRVYSCTHCGKGFANLDAANTHVQTHVEKAPGTNLKCDKDIHI